MQRACTLVLVVGVLWTSGLPGVAQNAVVASLDPAAAKDQLTGGTSRDWVFQQVRTIMGSSDRCSQGEVHRFKVDGSVTVERCLEGQLARETKRWTLERETSFDLRLVIDGDPYTVLFRNDVGAQVMVLRKRSNSKTSPTIDREFRLSLD